MAPSLIRSHLECHLHREALLSCSFLLLSFTLITALITSQYLSSYLVLYFPSSPMEKISSMRALSGLTDMTHLFQVCLQAAPSPVPATASASSLNKCGYFLSSFGNWVSFLNRVTQPAAREKAGLETQGYPQSPDTEQPSKEWSPRGRLRIKPRG